MIFKDEWKCLTSENTIRKEVRFTSYYWLSKLSKLFCRFKLTVGSITRQFGNPQKSGSTVDWVGCTLHGPFMEDRSELVKYLDTNFFIHIKIRWFKKVLPKMSCVFFRYILSNWYLNFRFVIDPSKNSI